MKRKLFKLLAVLSFLILSTEAFSQSAICNYGYRKRITFDPAQVAGPIDLVNFPAMIKINSDNDLRVISSGGYVTSADGYDIVFTAADGVTLLEHQLEYYVSTTGAITAWVKIPNLSTSEKTFIYMYYGNSTIITNQSVNTVWNNYHGVWHLQNNDFSDNSGNGYNTTNNATTNQSPAFINDGRALSGTNQWLEVSNTFPNITTNFSMSGWIYTTLNTKAGQRVFCDDRNDNGGYALSLGDGGTGRLRFFSRGSNPVILDGPANQIANNTWYYVTAVADITNGRKTIYVNGVQAATGTFVNAWGTDNGNCSIGGEPAGSPETANRFQGRLDEVRVANRALSADWILTEYNNQNSPATFYTVSAQPKVWVGGTNTNYNTASNWLGSSAPIDEEDVIINNGTNQPTLQSDVQVGSIWIRSGATLSLSTFRLSARFDITNCGTITGNTGRIRCNSTSNFIQNQYISGSGNYNLYNFNINNTYSVNPSIILLKDVNVDGNLVLNSGIVYTSNTNILALSSTATSASGSAASFVSGPMSKSGNADFVFPVGKGNRWRRCGISNITAASTFTAEYFNTPYVSTTPVNAPLTNVSLVEYWQCDRTGTGNANLTLYWEDASLSGITTCTDLTIARWNGTSWDERPGTAAGTCSGTGAGSVTTNAALTAFSPFTFGSKTAGNINPLPITLLTFTAVPAGKNVRINWSTATEKDVDYYEVEKSKDGVTFEFVGIIKSHGSGNSNTTMNYNTIDQKPYMGISYYRLKQHDKNKDFYYSPMVTVNFNEANNMIFSLYPNPAKNEFYLSGFFNEGSELIVRNILGEIVLPTTISVTNDQIQINCSEFAAGVYFVTLLSNGERETQKIIIK